MVIRSDLSWSSNTESMIARSNKKLWFIKKLRKLGANTKDLLDLCSRHIGSILEYAAPVWHSALTVEDRLRLERVQKSALHIILGANYKSYSSALKLTGTRTLFETRRKICLKFAKKALKSKKFGKWFKTNTLVTKTRRIQPKLKEVHCRTKRFKDSPISYLTDLLNTEH